MVLGRRFIKPQKWWLAGGIPESPDYTIYDPASAASEVDSYTNLANPGVRNAIPFNNPTFTPGVGWSGNGTKSATTNQLIEIGIIDGDIQHITIFDRLLTQQEINSLQ